MYGKVKNIWDIKTNGGGSSIDTQNFASKNKANTFTNKNIFENTGNVISIKSTDAQSFGIEFKNNQDQRVGYVGTSQNNAGVATIWGNNGLILQTTNNQIDINSGTGALVGNSSKTWNQYEDNSLLRKKDFKYVRKFEYLTSITQPTTSWNTTSWNWTLTNLNTQGIHDVLVSFSISNTIYTLNAKIPWKSGLTESKSPILTTTDGTNTYEFQLVIKSDNKFYVYIKKSGGSNNIQWVRGWILRETNQPYLMNLYW